MTTTSNRVLKFTKGSDKTDRIEFLLGSKNIAALMNPKQRILPHDMVHYAVEHSFGLTGFISLVFEGFDPEKTLEVLHGYSPILPKGYSMEAWIAESLVESFQACLWSNITSFGDFKYAYEKTCESRTLTKVAVSDAQFQTLLSLSRKLTEQWNALEPGASLELLF